MATENTGANENKKAGEAARKPRPVDGKTPVKKKKIIIVTGNSSKGRQSSGQRSAYSSGSYSSGAAGSFTSGTSGSGRKPRPAGQGGPRRDQSAGKQRTEAKPVPHKIIRPSVKPTQMEVDYHKPEQAVRQPKKVQEPVPAAEEIKITTAAPEVPAVEPVITAAAPEVEKKPVEAAAAEEIRQPVEEPAEKPAEKPVQASEPVEIKKEQPEIKAVSESAPEEAAKEVQAEEVPARSAQIRTAEETDNRQRAGQRDRDNRGASQRDRSAQGQNGPRRDNRGGEQSGSRRDNRGSEQGGFRRDNRSGDQSGFRRDNRSGDQGGTRRDNRGGDQSSRIIQLNDGRDTEYIMTGFFQIYLPHLAVRRDYPESVKQLIASAVTNGLYQVSANRESIFLREIVVIIVKLRLISFYDVPWFEFNNIISSDQPVFIRSLGADHKNAVSISYTVYTDYIRQFFYQVDRLYCSLGLSVDHS